MGGGVIVGWSTRNSNSSQTWREMKCDKYVNKVYLKFQLAYVEDLNGPWLFDSMYVDDPEAGKLAALPGMEELLAAYPYK